MKKRLELDALIIEETKKEAESVGLSLTDYLLYQVLQKLDDLRVTAYVEGE